jgi:type I restriction enzyme S subunit
MKYQTYPNYKPSGVEWLGDVPEHWGITRIKYVSRIFGRIGFRGYTIDDIVDPEDGAIVLSPSNIDIDRLSFANKVYLSWKKYYESPEIMVEAGDILLVKTGSTFGKSAIIKMVQEPMTINPQMALIKKSKVDSTFLSYLFNSPFFKANIEINNTGSGMPTMTQENINTFPVPLPTSIEAEKIANFLDHETAKIDTLIEKQQRLIALLKEKRQAVISHAVTKGLNPNAPMKPSGVEWLGDVPVGWRIGSLRWFIGIASGDGLLNSEFEKEKDEQFKYRVIGGNGTLGYSSSVNTTMKAFAIGRVGALCGNVHFVDEHCWITDNALKLSSWREFNEGYLYFLLTAARLNEYANKNAQPLITGEQIKSLTVVIPAVSEQIEIVSFIQKTIAKIDDLTIKATSAIELMQERRTALISAAVTGKIDVRDWGD